MWTDSITKEDVNGRARVSKLAPTDPGLALKAARGIKHPWYRCQALSTVAEHLDADRGLDLLLEALDVAKQQSEVNRIVTVSAWPMRHLIKHRPVMAERQIKSLVALANTEPHTLRRADALFALAWSVSGARNQLQLIVPSLVQALLSGHGWRIDRLIRHSVELVQAAQPETLASLVAHHSENRKKKQLISKIHELQI